MNKTQKFMNFFRHLDAFGQPVSLYIKGKTKHQTSFGGIITVILSITVLTITIKSFVSLVKKFDLTTDQKTTYELDPPVINIRLDEFMFSIGLADSSISFNNSIFSYSFQLSTENNVDGEKTEVPIDIGPCQQQDYGNIVPGYRNKYENMICPKNFSFGIQGASESDIFQYIKIVVKQCINNENSFITCASDDFIIKYFEENQYVKMNLYFVNRVADLQNLTSPFKAFIDEQTWFLSKLGDLVRSTDIYFKSNQIVSYDDIFGIAEPNIYTTVNYEKERIDNPYVPQKQSTTYAEIYLKSSNYANYNVRYYGDLLKLLSFIGGIMNILMSSTGVLVVIINNFIYKINIMNELYDFDLQDDDSKKSDKIDPKKIKESNNIQTNEFLNNSKVKQQFDRMQNLRSLLVFNAMDFFRYICFCLKWNSKNKKIRLYKLANDQLAKDMDIMWIMKKIQDIQKLKTIILHPNKIKIFEFVPPPIISTDDRIMKIYDNPLLVRKSILIQSPMNQLISLKKFDNICQDINQYYKYSNLYRDLKNQEDSISQNIIQSLDPDIAEIFECIEEEKNRQKKDEMSLAIELGASMIENSGNYNKEIIQNKKILLEASLGDNPKIEFNHRFRKDSENVEISIQDESSDLNKEKYIDKPVKDTVINEKKNWRAIPQRTSEDLDSYAAASIKYLLSNKDGTSDVIPVAQLGKNQDKG